MSKDSPTVARFEVFEITLSSATSVANPFTDAEIRAVLTGPDGAQRTVLGFYYGQDQWKVRFVPSVTGSWIFQAKLTIGQTETTGSGKFECTESGRPGFVRFSNRNPYRFEYDNGTPFYPIGQQVGWGVPEQPGFDAPDEKQWTTTDRETFMRAFDGATNLVRSQLGTGTTSGVAIDLIPGSDVLRYDLEACRRVDESCQAIKRYGWAQILVPIQDMSMWQDIKTCWGGLRELPGYRCCDGTKIEAIERYLRYVVARWSAYTDIWEIFNEDSYSPPEFIAHLAKVIRECDPYRHPISTNYEWPTEPWCEIVCAHEYMGIDAREVPYHLSKEFARIKSFGKPAIFTEFGNSRNQGNVDRTKWRVAAWTAFMNESALVYWNMSGRRLERPLPGRNAYFGPETRSDFRILNEFSRSLPIDMRPALAYSNHQAVQMWSLANRTTAVTYLHNGRGYDKPLDPGNLALFVTPGTWTIHWIDPQTGATVKEERSLSRGNTILLSPPPVHIDLAARIVRTGDEVHTESAQPVTPAEPETLA